MEAKDYREIGERLTELRCPRTVGCTFTDGCTQISVQTNGRLEKPGFRFVSNLEEKAKFTMVKDQNNGEFRVLLQPVAPEGLSVLIKETGKFVLRGTKQFGEVETKGRFDSEKVEFDALATTSYKIGERFRVIGTAGFLSNFMDITLQGRSSDFVINANYSFLTRAFTFSSFVRVDGSVLAKSVTGSGVGFSTVVQPGQTSNAEWFAKAVFGKLSTSVIAKIAKTQFIVFRAERTFGCKNGAEVTLAGKVNYCASAGRRDWGYKVGAGCVFAKDRPTLSLCIGHDGSATVICDAKLSESASVKVGGYVRDFAGMSLKALQPKYSLDFTFNH